MSIWMTRAPYYLSLQSETISPLQFPPPAPKKRKVSFRVESDDDDEAVGTAAKKNDSKQASKKVGKAVQPPTAALTATLIAKQNKTEQPHKSTLVTEMNPRKRKIAAPPAEEPAAKKVDNAKPAPQSAQKKSLKPAPRQRLPYCQCHVRRCPPETLNERLLSLFVKRQELISEVGHRGPGVSTGRKSSIIDEASDSFDECDDTSDLIALKDFVAFILTPFTTALLIAEDRDISLEDATDCRTQVIISAT
ncbi:hypothetical protein B0H11DRAFT_2219860 [Mycena galericulata]|nr:hypothetical protein B0H11DRAFT_2219860 [Mycena galericulata]